MVVKEVRPWRDEIRIWLDSALSFGAVRSLIEEWESRTSMEVVQIKEDVDGGIDIYLRVPWNINVKGAQERLLQLFELIRLREEAATEKAARIAAAFGGDEDEVVPN